jgi:hypothetical protein
MPSTGKPGIPVPPDGVVYSVVLWVVSVVVVVTSSELDVE